MDVDRDPIRAKFFMNFLKKFTKESNNLIALDVGCSYGTITFEMAKYFKKVIGIENNEKVFKISYENAQNFQNVEILNLNFFNNKFTDNQFDFIIFNGVFEWLGKGYPHKKPLECQLVALEESKRILKKGGFIFIGIENKLFPYYWLVDPHTKTPLTVILPHKFSKRLYKLLYQRYYGISILSHMGYIKLLNQKFKKITTLIPIPDYKYIMRSSLAKGKILRKQIKDILRTEHLNKNHKLKLFWLFIISVVPLVKILSPSFIFIIQKS